MKLKSRQPQNLAGDQCRAGFSTQKGEKERKKERKIKEGGGVMGGKKKKNGWQNSEILGITGEPASQYLVGSVFFFLRLLAGESKCSTFSKTHNTGVQSSVSNSQIKSKKI
jgi:hypothetical protein